MNSIGKKIREVRKRKGLSQEQLAATASVNLRTIQRIENDESEPRGKTLNLICEVLDINAEDILDYGKNTDKNYLIYFHLSVLSGLVIPTGNIIIPLVLWLNKKEKIIGLKSIGSNLLNFQIIWTFFSFLAIIAGAFFKITHLVFGPPNLLIYIWGILYFINIVLPIVFAVKTKNGKTENLYPRIIEFIK